LVSCSKRPPTLDGWTPYDRVAQELDSSSTKVSEIMTRKVTMLGGDNTCRDALAVMKRLHVRHLPVMAGKRIAGCISLRELQVGGIKDKEVEIKFLDHP
jgi:signal-transduction protein with cAMP-binding, CBS, and nucleotidyltransferase domain